MRRLLALTVAVAVAVFSSGAACSAERSGSDAADGPGGSPPPAAATPGAGVGATGASAASRPAGGNAAQVCDAAQQAGGTAVRTYVAELGRMIGAVGDNDSATAEAARKRAEAALTGWRDALREQSARATDPQLRTLLADLASEVGGLGTDLDAIDEEELERLQQRLDQLCGVG
jgi:hypothetical protein